MKTLLPLSVAFAFALAPLTQASIVSDFKADLNAKIGTKTGKAAAKAAVKVTAQYVVKPPKGDPKKIVNFTKIANKALKKILDAKGYATYAQQWSKQVMYSYFKKGKVKYSPTDKKFSKALDIVLKFLPAPVASNQTVIQKTYNFLKVNNQKLGGTDQDRALLQQQVAEETGTTPVS